jgi:NAD(P)H dehydrogenase (quinone)
MPIAVTGATGQLGRLVVEELLARGVPANQVVATGRAIEKIKDLADSGVQTRAVDYDDLDSLRAAFADVDKVLLISGSEVGKRVAQHENAIAAAAEAAVELLVYTSIAGADRSSIRIADDHRATEQALAATGLPVTLLRNSWYMENYTGQIPVYLEHGAILGCAGDGRVSAATRADFAAAAAAVLATEGHAGRTYELGGDMAFRHARACGGRLGAVRPTGRVSRSYRARLRGGTDERWATCAVCSGARRLRSWLSTWRPARRNRRPQPAHWPPDGLDARGGGDYTVTQLTSSSGITGDWVPV